jgi:hypothetical protein
MQCLADQGYVGGVLVRLMMVLQDFGFAKSGHASDRKSPKKKRLGDVRRAAGRYFLRLQISHCQEGLKIIREIKNDDALQGLLLSCDKPTKNAYAELEAFLDTPVHELMETIRNKVGFHYDPTMVRDSIRRIERRRLRQVGKRKGGLPDTRRPIDVVRFSTAADMHKSQYVPWEMVENDIVMHDIFGLAESDTHAGDKALDAAADEIVVRLHEVQRIFSFFAINFIMRHARSS